MEICYIKVTCHDLPAEVAVAIHSTPQHHKTPEAVAKFCQAQAKRQGLNASYEAVSKAEYVAFRESRKAAIADKAMAVANEVAGQ